MALVDRGGRPYLNQSKRAGGCVTSEFVASGETALRLLRRDAPERQADAPLDLIVARYVRALGGKEGRKKTRRDAES